MKSSKFEIKSPSKESEKILLKQTSVQIKSRINNNQIKSKELNSK